MKTIVYIGMLYWEHAIAACNVPVRNSGNSKKFEWATKMTTMAYIQYVPLHNGFHDLQNGHVGFEQWFRSGTPQRTTSIVSCRWTKKEPDKEGRMKTIAYVDH